MTISGIDFGTPGAPGGTLVAVPLVEGEARGDAEKMLTGLGFRTVATEVVSAGDEDKVYRQEPKPPTERPPGSTIRIFVTKKPVTQPDPTNALEELKKVVDGVDTKVTALDTTVQGVAAAVAAAETEQAAGNRAVEVGQMLQSLSDKVDELSNQPGPTRSARPK